MTVATPNQDYLAFEAAMKARDPRWYESSPACIGYMAWCASRDSAPPPAGGERERYAFVLAQCREAQELAASRGWALNAIATASTTDPKARKIATEALLSAPSQPEAQQERKPLTDEQIDRHSIAAVDCPPSSTVILVSSLRRLLGITATKGGA